MIPRRHAEAALERALRSGGDFAELFLEDTQRNAIRLIDGQIDNATAGRSHGAGIRILRGVDSVYVHTNDTSLDGLLKAAGQAADAVKGSGAMDVKLMGSIVKNIHPISILPSDVEGRRKSELVHRAYRAAKDEDSAIAQVSVTLTDVDASVSIANSEGLFVSDRRVYTRLGIEAIAAGGSENQVGFEGPGAMMGFELFETRIDVEKVARGAAKTAATMLRAEFCPAGVMPVAIDGGFGGVIFHEACGHSLEATSVGLGHSEFCGKLNQVIASPCVTAVDDGTIQNEWGSLNIDDEGLRTTKLVLIEDGVLKNYMIDRVGERRMNMPRTGSARRQNYTFAPTSRMRNTYIAAGEDDEGEIIRTMGDGLYAKKMGGGSVNPVTGEFNFSVMEAYLVKDGKIHKPVRGATLIGKGSEILLRIDRVAKNMTMAQGVCGSLSGAVPTNVGQPLIRVKSMTVGGR